MTKAARIAVLGQGSMGSMILRKLMESNYVPADSVVVRTGSPEKAISIHRAFPGVTVTDDNSQAVRDAAVVLICCKPLQVKSVLREIRPEISQDTHVVSIAGCVSIADIHEIAGCYVTKVIPSVLSEVNEGISLVCHDPHVPAQKQAFVENLFSCFSYVRKIPESQFELATALTSCSPGLFSKIFAEFIDSASRHGSIDSRIVHEMVVQTLQGFSKLVVQKGMELPEIANRVASKGGTTEEGLKVLRRGLPGLFDETYKAILDKHTTNKILVKNS